VHGPPFIFHAIVQFTQSGQRRPGGRRQIGPETGQRLRFFKDPGKFRPSRDRNAVKHHGPPEIEPGSDPGNVRSRPRTQLLGEQRLDVLRANAAGRQLLAIPRFGQERFAPQLHAGTSHRVFEGQMLERVQRVVVDEDADRSLGRQQVRELVDDARQRLVG
jgi:hypothetical protein